MISPVRLFLLGLLVTSSVDVWAVNLSKPPRPEDLQPLLSAGWPAARDQLAGELAAAYRPFQGLRAGSSSDPAFLAWLDVWRWCELMSRDEAKELSRFVAGESNFEPGRETSNARLVPRGYTPGGGTLADRLGPKVAAELSEDPPFLAEFFRMLSPLDFTPGAIDALRQIREAEETRWADYRSLAIAVALVFDQRVPGRWPHHQVKPSAVPREEVVPIDAFRHWADDNVSGKLLLDLRKLNAGQIKFIVDAPVKHSEIEWAQKNVRYSRTNFGQAFGSIHYLNARLVKQEYDWPEGEDYTLANIQSTGGICVDQAYFAMLSGKARGLPTLYFSGQGTDGGHAWFGYMKTDDRWDLDCGRYQNQNYTKGEALDPQTWQPINDHELKFLAEHFRDTPAFLASLGDLAVAGMFEGLGDRDKMLSALDSAVAACPQNPDVWDARWAALTAAGAPPAKKRAHLEAALKQFGANPDVRMGYQNQLVDLLRSNGDEQGARQLEAQMIGENRRGRIDLSVAVASQQVLSPLAKGDTDTAMKEFRNQLTRVGKSGGGGNFYYDVVRPLVIALAKAGKTHDALRVSDQARKALRPEEGGILDQDLGELEAWVNKINKK